MLLAVPAMRAPHPLALVVVAVLVAAHGCGVEMDGRAGTGERGAAGVAVRGVRDAPIVGAGLPDHTVVLTYDDGPTVPTLPIARLLADEGISATFFVAGKRVRAYDAQHPETAPILRTLVELGHTIANHTEHHLRLTDPATHVLDEIRTAQALIDPFVPDGAYFLRPPGILWSPTVARTVRTDSRLDRLFGPIGWDVEGGFTEGGEHFNDYDCWPVTDPDAGALDVFPGATDDERARACAAGFVDSLEVRRGGRGSILIMHDWAPGNPGYDGPYRLTRELVPALQALGYEFRTLKDLPGASAVAQPVTSVVDPPAQAPADVAFGDVDGDGHAERCQIGAEGILCSADGGAPASWSDDDLGRVPAGAFRLADIDADGRADACVAAPAGVRCALSTGNGFGRAAPFGPSSDLVDPGWLDAEAGFSMPDVDGDRRADLCAGGPSDLRCWGTGRAPGPALGTPRPPEQVVAADLDHDGDADVAFLRDRELRWLPESAAGSGAPATIATLDPVAAPRSLVAGDVTGDGRVDLVVARTEGDTVLLDVVESLPGGFAPPNALWSAAVRPRTSGEILGGDFDGDGRMDILLLGGDGEARTWLELLRGSDSGFEEPRVVWDSGAGQWSASRTRATVGDLDGDGRSDVALVYDYGSDRVGFFWFVGSDDLGQPVPIWRSNPGDWSADRTLLSAADPDGDGVDEVVAIYRYGDQSLGALVLGASGGGAPLSSFRSTTPLAAGTVPVAVEPSARALLAGGVRLLEDGGAGGTALWTLRPQQGEARWTAVRDRGGPRAPPAP